MGDKKAWGWGFVVFVIGATRAHELGISLDPALYASLSRTIATEGGWWSPAAGPFLFPEYYEHPYLILWLQALFFKVFGASDTVTRYLGLCFGVGSFYFLYRLGRDLLDETYAHLLAFLTLFSVYFTGRIPSLYHEVGMVFFVLASLSVFLTGLRRQDFRFSVAAGALMGAAFLSKGLAAVPALPGALTLCFVSGLGNWNQRASQAAAALGTTASVVALAVVLQEHFGTFSFWDNYIGMSLGGKVMGTGIWFPRWPFTAKLIETHGVHLLLGAAGLYRAYQIPRLRDAVLVGTVTGLSFYLANGKLNKTHLHYFYAIYPFANFAAAASLWSWASRRSPQLWSKIALRFAVVYVIAWHLLPLHMRRHPEPSFFQLAGAMEVLKDNGVTYLETPIRWSEWGYREIGYWYWGLDSRVDTPPQEWSGEAGVLRRPEGADGVTALTQGYSVCAESQRFVVFVRDPELAEKCRSAGIPKRLLR